MNRRDLLKSLAGAVGASVVPAPVLKPRSVGASTIAAQGARRFVRVFDYTQGNSLVLWYYENTALGNVITTAATRSPERPFIFLNPKA